MVENPSALEHKSLWYLYSFTSLSSWTKNILHTYISIQIKLKIKKEIVWSGKMMWDDPTFILHIQHSYPKQTQRS
jgi:hypothetical protein